MSRWLGKADALAAKIRTIPEVADMQVIVNREEDLLSQVNEAIEKAAGLGCVVVKWLGGSNPDKRSSVLRLGARYSISLWTVPVLYDGPEVIVEGEPVRLPADDVIEKIAEAIHGWEENAYGSLVNRLEVEDVEVVPDPPPGQLVHEILAAIARV